MQLRSVLMSFMNTLFGSRYLRALLGLIGILAAYLQFRDAGATPLFWVLLIVALLFSMLLIVPVLRNAINIRRQRVDRDSNESTWKSQRLRILTELVKEFERVEKSKALLSEIGQRSPIRILTIRSTPSPLGVILNAGSQENVQVGTQLIVFRTDERTPGGEDVEKPLAIVEVTYVQVANNCCQAIVVRELDECFWNQVRADLISSNSLNPPRNFAIPHIPRELQGLSLEDITVVRQYLQRIREHLAKTS
jgi:hypothetical protein